MAKTSLHAEGESSAHALIRAGHYDMATPWSFSAEDGDALLGPKGDDWDKFGRWHLGEDASEPRETKAHWKYPYGKDGKVYRRALASIRSRASQNGDGTIFDAAGRLMTAMDQEEEKKESTMSLRETLAGGSSLRQILSLGGRFGHFAAPPAASRAEEGSEDDEAARAAAKKAEEDEARRKAEEDAKARGNRRSRKARRAKAKKEDNKNDDDDDDADDASDDDEDEEDEDQMKKAASAGHTFALDAAFRLGARAQRRRCAAIFAHKAAGAHPVLAMSLAFETSMTAAAAIAVLENTPPPARAGSLHERMATSPSGAVRVAPGAPGAPSGPQAIAASRDQALKAFAPAR